MRLGRCFSTGQCYPLSCKRGNHQPLGWLEPYYPDSAMLPSLPARLRRWEGASHSLTQGPCCIPGHKDSLPCSSGDCQMVRPKSLRQHSTVLSERGLPRRTRQGEASSLGCWWWGIILKGLHWAYFLTEPVQLASLFLPLYISFWIVRDFFFVFYDNVFISKLQPVICVCIFYIHGF